MNLGLGLSLDKQHLNSDHNLNYVNQFIKNQNTYSRSTNQQLFNDMQSTGGNIPQFTNNTQVILIFINSCSYFRDTILHINHNNNLLIFKAIILIQRLKILHKPIITNQIT